MASNEHGAMKQNEEYHETNNSIYYMRETELYAESYDAMNMAIYCKNIRTSVFRGEMKKSTFSDPIGPSSGTACRSLCCSPEREDGGGEGGAAGEGGAGRGDGVYVTSKTEQCARYKFFFFFFFEAKSSSPHLSSNSTNSEPTKIPLDMDTMRTRSKSGTSRTNLYFQA